MKKLILVSLVSLTFVSCKKETKDPNAKTPTGNKFGLDVPNSISNEFDMTSNISIDLEL